MNRFKSNFLFKPTVRSKAKEKLDKSSFRFRFTVQIRFEHSDLIEKTQTFLEQTDSLLFDLDLIKFFYLFSISVCFLSMMIIVEVLLVRSFIHWEIEWFSFSLQFMLSLFHLFRAKIPPIGSRIWSSSRATRQTTRNREANASRFRWTEFVSIETFIRMFDLWKSIENESSKLNEQLQGFQQNEKQSQTKLVCSHESSSSNQVE